jgi:hypothetical protein
MMRQFLPVDVTADARRIAAARASDRESETGLPLAAPRPRSPLAESFDASRGRREVKIDAKARDLILFGHEPIDLRYVEQLIDVSQTRAVGYAIHLAATRLMDGRTSLPDVLASVQQILDDPGLDALAPFRRADHHPGDFARPRPFEIAAAINRLRTVRMRDNHANDRTD